MKRFNGFRFGDFSLPFAPRYLLYRALGALVPYIVGTWGVRVNESSSPGDLCPRLALCPPDVRPLGRAGFRAKAFRMHLRTYP